MKIGAIAALFGRRHREQLDAGIPLRGSVRDKDFDFDLGSRIDVFLDGQLQSKVIGYDVRRGKVHRFVTDRDGEIKRIRLTPNRDACLEERLSGRVEVRWKEAVDG